MSIPPVDRARTEAFLNKVLADTSGFAVTAMAAIGDRLGLFKDLTLHGPATSAELAGRTHTQERYIREWLAVMTSTAYLEYDPTSAQFTLPAAHVPVLAQENGPIFFGGTHQMLMGMLGPYEHLLSAFRQGGGIMQGEYGDDLWDGLERSGAAWVENTLVSKWLPALPDVRAMLDRGVRLADVGCGRGRALVKLATTFPKSHFTGYDVFAPALEKAATYAEAAGVSDRVRFEPLDAGNGLPETFDVITTFDVVHDAVDPLRLMKALRRALVPGGRYVCMDVACSPRLEENSGALPALRYGFSIMYCLTTSLAHDGAGLGALGLSEVTLRDLCAAAGFGGVRRVPLGDSAVDALYEITLEPLPASPFDAKMAGNEDWV